MPQSNSHWGTQRNLAQNWFRTPFHTAQRLELSANSEDHDLRSGTDDIVSAALLLSRDGTNEQLDQDEDWARNAFERAFATGDNDGASIFRDGIMFNPVAIATLGLIHLWRRGRSDEREALLQLTDREDASAAHGFGAGLAVLYELDPRLPPSLLRCVLHAQIFSRLNWDTPQEEKEKAAKVRARRVSEAISAELEWLGGAGVEPAWPALPPRTISIRRGIRIGVDEVPVRQQAGRQQATQRNSEQLRSQTAANWVRQLTRHADRGDVPWLLGFVEAYSSWTADANGKGLALSDMIDRSPDEWNSVFYPLMAHAFTRMPADQAATLVAEVTALPDESFFDIVENLVPAIDEVYFNALGINLDIALRLRTLLADRLMESAGWRMERERTEMSVEMKIGSAIAPLFFCHHNSFTGSKCYLLVRGIDQVDAFLPTFDASDLGGLGPFYWVVDHEPARGLTEARPLALSVVEWTHLAPPSTEKPGALDRSRPGDSRGKLARRHCPVLTRRYAQRPTRFGLRLTTCLGGWSGLGSRKLTVLS